MDSLEKIAYSLLGLVSLLYLVVMVAGLIAAFPWGIIGLIVIVGIGLLLINCELRKYMTFLPAMQQSGSSRD